MKHACKLGALILSLSAAVCAQIQIPLPHTPAKDSRPVASADLRPSGKAVAKVNGAVLTDRDLLREMYAIFPYAQQHGGGFPKSMQADIRRGALRMIEFEELVYQEALRRKMSIPPTRLNQAERDFHQQFHSPEEYAGFLKAEFSGSRTLLRRKIERSLLIDACLRAEVATKAKVTSVQAKQYYEKNPVRFEREEIFAIQSISILPPKIVNDQSRKDVRKRAEEALRQAKATKSYEEFGVLAEKISEDDYRVMMGDHKPTASSGLPPEIVHAALAMQPGQVSSLIAMGDAYTIFRLNAHTPAGKLKYADVEKQLVVELQKTRSDQLRATLDKKLRKGAKVEEL
jgi:peptidyl-prolyl cis-trans isomerase SurA